MKKIYILFILFAFVCGPALAQYPLVTIRQIQEVHPDSLLAGNDLSEFNGDTVRFRGVVTTPPGAGRSSSTNGRWIWIQDGKGPWGGINVRKNNGTATTPQDILFGVPGDSVEITGVVNTFSNETQLDPLDSNGFTVLGASTVKWNSTSDLSDFANINALPNTVVGEPWEGQLFEFTNVTVVSVTATAQDIRFRVQDVSGNEVEVYDTYMVQQPSGVTCTNCLQYPPFVPPSVGDVFDTLRGTIDGRAFGTTFPYSIAPFDTTHYVYGAAAPRINSIFRDISVPTSSQMVTVTANITDNGGAVTGARLFYALGETNPNFTQVNMTNSSGSDYTGSIPAGSNNQMVKFYIEADDNAANTTVSPGGAPTTKSHFYWVKDGGQLSIRDIQYTPFTDGQSGYIGETVTVGGVVSATAAPSQVGLGALYIQDRSNSTWSGIWISPGANIDPISEYGSMLRGDTVVITGIVQENFGMTRIELDNFNDFNILGSLNPVAPTDVDPTDFTSYSLAFEGYESMLVRFVPSTAGPQNDSLYAVDDNSDDPSDFGEWRVGHDPFDPNTGSRVLAGRDQGSNNFSFTTARNDLVVNPGLPHIIVTQGARIHDLTGIMYYSFSNWKLLPRNNSDISDYNGVLYSGLLDGVEIGLKVFPNPSQDHLTISFSEELNSNLEYSIISILGKQMSKGLISEQTQTLDISNLASGQYLLTIKDQKGEFRSSHRIIVQ